ncbi:type IV pilus modification protein PilV [Salinicola avicenniae]|uniref:type IV pilus modification protein PilV n=1 Tax=Salinicola avicenniae TaxID=2916836 RepID=UPI0020746CA9|nr:MULTISPECIES: type IV pilus modification protein PilV [unclassified Salinicola]
MPISAGPISNGPISNEPASAPVRQRGLSLIEVLVAVAVFSIGLLGTARLLAEQTRLGQEAGFRSTATILAEDLLERVKLRADHLDGYLGAYETTGASDAGDAPAATETPPADLNAWGQEMLARRSLPAPRVCVSRVETTEVSVVLVWQARLPMTPPEALPDCVAARDNGPYQRWVRLDAWVGES